MRDRRVSLGPTAIGLKSGFLPPQDYRNDDARTGASDPSSYVICLLLSISFATMATYNNGLALQDGQSLQWDRHRSKIRRLYLEEKKTLREVRRIMNQDDSFHAT